MGVSPGAQTSERVFIRGDTVVTPHGVGAYDIAISGEKIAGVAAADRPQAGDAGTHAQSSSLPPLILFHFVRQRGPGPDQRHVAFHDVPQLRPLIDRKFPEPSADAGQARGVGDLHC